MALDTTVRHYTSSMNGASLLDNTANSFIKILDAVLVNGFGNVTLTSLTVSNNIATANVSTGYNVAPYCVVTISGATPSGLNGDKKVLSSGNVVSGNTTTFTFDATGVANGAATGTITCRFPGAGWTKPFANTAANVAVYRNSTANGGTGLYLRVDDNVSSPAGLIAYESMTDVNTGTNRFPRTDQTPSGTGIGFIKAIAAGKKWWIVADSKTCYIANAFNAADSYVAQTGFGDFKSVKVGDPYCYFITGRNGTADTTTIPQGINNLLITQTGTTYRFAARGFNGISRSINYNNRFFGDNLLTSTVSGDDSGFEYPNLIDNSLIVVPLFLTHSNMLRGQHRGFYVTPQNINSTSRILLNDEEITNVSSLPGKILLYKALSIDQTDSGGFFVDVSGPWD